MLNYDVINTKDVIKVTLCMKTRWKDEFLKFLIFRVLSNIKENHVFFKKTVKFYD